MGRGKKSRGLVGRIGGKGKAIDSKVKEGQERNETTGRLVGRARNQY